jgi:hypothetical protein
MNGLFTGRGLKDVRDDANLGIFWLLIGGTEKVRGRAIIVWGASWSVSKYGGGTLIVVSESGNRGGEAIRRGRFAMW